MDVVPYIWHKSQKPPQKGVRQYWFFEIFKSAFAFLLELFCPFKSDNGMQLGDVYLFSVKVMYLSF